MSSRSLDALTVQDFAEVLGQELEVSEDAATPPLTVLRLKRLDELREAPNRDLRKPFSLTFEGPADVALEQRTYCFKSPALGQIEIFIVPIAQDQTTRTYEAIFA